jgi:hypothetical protein
MLPQNLVACSDCDMLQRIPVFSPGESARCSRCGHALAVSKTDSLDRTLSLMVAAANFSMGLLKAEQGDRKGAERYLRQAWKTDPQMGQAAYNLCVILSESKQDEAVGW